MNDLTVFVIATDKNPNLPLTLESLKNQSKLDFDFDIIKNYSPCYKAFQQMIERCKTQYYIEVDEDMILKPNAIEKLYKKIISLDDKHPFACFSLLDKHLNFKIYGIKAYKHDVFKKFPYLLDNPSGEVEQLARLEKAGYIINDVHCISNEIIGEHSPLWTNELIFRRYYNLMEKQKLFHYKWIETLPLKLLSILLENPSIVNFYAIAGALASIYSDSIPKDNLTNYEKVIPSLTNLQKALTKKLTILKVIDQFGWAYYFIAKDQQKYSKHHIVYKRLIDLTEEKLKEINPDIVYFHGPNLGLTEVNKLTKFLKNQNKIVIGGYGSENTLKYDYADLIVSISLPHIKKLKEMYNNQSIIFLPESIDTEYFTAQSIKHDKFNIGWAGSITRDVKRAYLLDLLLYPVIKQCDWGKNFIDGHTQKIMLDFYKQLDVFISVSSTEAMPRVILEAMSCGLPVISTDVGSVRLLLDSEWIVPALPETTVIEEMNKKLTLLKNNSNLRKKVGKRNREFIEKYFSWKVNQPLWDNVFQLMSENNKEDCINLTNQFLLELNVDTEDIYNKFDVLMNFLKSLNEKVEFWFLNKSCLELVNHHRITSHEIFIGVRDEKIKNKIYDLIKSIKILNVTFVIEIDKNMKIKKFDEFNVPVPVVTYLEETFKKDWKSLQNE